MFSRHKVAQPTFQGAPVHTNHILPWVSFFLRPHRRLFAVLTVNRLFRMVFFVGIQPLLIAKMVQAFENGTAYANPSIMWNLMLTFAVLSSIVYVLIIVCTEEAKLGDRTSRSARLLGLAQLNRLSVQWHEESDSGGKLQKIMTGSIGLRQLIRSYFLNILSFIAGFIGSAIALVGMGLPLIYVAMFAGLMVTYIAAAWWSSIFVARGYDKQNQLLENLIGKVYEFVNASLTVKIFNLGDHVLAHAQEGEQTGYKQSSQIYTLDYCRWIGLNFIGLFWMLLITYVAITQTLSQTLSLTAFALVVYQVLKVWNMMEDFTSMYSEIIEQSSAFKRLTTLLAQHVQVTDIAATTPLKVENGAIEFRNVSFAYNAKHPVFEGLELNILPGEKVGIIGRSGSGKSTLIKLLLRFYDPVGNEIIIDRQNIRTVSQDSLRQNIAVIPQDVSLFNHSVMDNIRYGRLAATDDEVIQAAQLANADEFIRKLPAGYQTLVGEKGAKLSGGQCQRIAIARAILKDAPILILDEATSALDTHSEQLIQASLARLMGRKTVIAIAHRLSTIAALDRILVFDKGRIVEEGTHQSLLAQNGLYAKLWQSQTMHN
ncbi:MAG: ABC transporter ATP-binding protein [Alphaproteobacteria bacterium]|nr:MAG: ABC transporter ATP-binding protein [Alphaproteobacteria bacterium]